MSRAKASVLAIGLLAVVAVAFVGASSYVSSTKSYDSTSMSCDTRGDAQAAASQSSGSCPRASGVTANTDKKNCPMSASCPKTARCSKSCGAKSTKTAKVESIEAIEGEVFTLTGRYVCGSCELGIGEGCQPAFKTTDGKNYLLSRNNLSKKLREEARDTNVEIVSRVKKYDGVKYLEVEAVRAAS
jgi:hypothetical protein